MMQRPCFSPHLLAFLSMVRKAEMVLKLSSFPVGVYLLDRSMVQRSRQCACRFHADTLVHPVELGTHMVAGPPIVTCGDPAQEEVNVDLKEAETIGCLHQVCIRPTALFVGTYEPRNVDDERLADPRTGLFYQTAHVALSTRMR